MPYIQKQHREVLDPLIDALSAALATEGDLNYALTRLVLGTLRRSGVTYAAIATLSGVLKNVSDEFYRRLAGPYEDLKREQNGDLDDYRKYASAWSRR